MRLYELLGGLGGGGKYVCKACDKLGGSGGMLPSLGNFDFGPFIRCNLVESGTMHTMTDHEGRLLSHR